MDITNHLVLGLPISVAEVGTIYQPTLEELVMAYGDIDDFFFPFMMNKNIYSEYFGENEIDNIKDFDLFFVLDEKGEFLFKGRSDNFLIYDLMSSLSLIFRSDKVDLIYENEIIVIDDKIEINRYNFDIISKIILEMGMKEKFQPPEKLTFKSERKRKLHEKIEQRRAEIRRRNAPTTGDLINTLVNNPVRGFSFEEVKKITVWQLLNSYKEILNIDNHEQTMKYKVSYKYNVEDEVQHWRKANKMQKIIIDK